MVWECHHGSCMRGPADLPCACKCQGASGCALGLSQEHLGILLYPKVSDCKYMCTQVTCHRAHDPMCLTREQWHAESTCLSQGAHPLYPSGSQHTGSASSNLLLVGSTLEGRGSSCPTAYVGIHLCRPGHEQPTFLSAANMLQGKKNMPVRGFTRMQPKQAQERLRGQEQPGGGRAMCHL